MTDLKMIADKTFLFQTDDASLDNLVFSPEHIGLLSVRFTFLTKEITRQKKVQQQ
jgi:hypothetical protein